MANTSKEPGHTGIAATDAAEGSTAIAGKATTAVVVHMVAVIGGLGMATTIAAVKATINSIERKDMGQF